KNVSRALVQFHHRGKRQVRLYGYHLPHGWTVQHRREGLDELICLCNLGHDLGPQKKSILTERWRKLVDKIKNAFCAVNQCHPDLRPNFRRSNWAVRIECRGLKRGPYRFAANNPSYKISDAARHVIELSFDLRYSRADRVYIKG